MPVRPRRLTFVIVIALGLAYECYALFVQPHGLARASAASTRMVGEVNLATGVRQTFLMNANGLDGIAVRARAAGATVQGEAVLELSEVLGGADAAAVYRIARPAPALVSSGWYWWRFPSLGQSRGRRYRLDISLPKTPGGAGLVFEATAGNVYRDGMLWVGEREHWGDLVFETSASEATVFAGLRSLWRDLPWNLGAVSFWVMFGLFNAALALVGHALLCERGVA